MIIKRLILIAIIPALLLVTVTRLHAEPLKLAEWNDGTHHFAFDGVFYSYVSLTGQGIKLWVPPDDKPVRGVIPFSVRFQDKAGWKPAIRTAGFQPAKT